VNDADIGRITALRNAMARLPSEAQFAPALRALRIANIRLLEDDAYTVLRRYERDADIDGYPVLR